MKTTFTLLALMLTTILTAQTVVNLSGMNSDIILGEDCSSSQPMTEFVANGDLNLNGYTLHLRNAHLKVNGNINGNGSVVGCGVSKICKTGSIQNNPNIEHNLLVDCSVLDVDSFESIDSIPKNIEYSLYNLMGQEIYKGNTSLLYIPLNQVVIIKVGGFQSKKIFVE